VNKPALVLDIDETSLSNWPNIKANNFGFIPDGACDRLPNGPCGFKAWILQGLRHQSCQRSIYSMLQKPNGWR
jgi:acid phosphatase